MECPEGLDCEDDEVLLLLKTIYGLVQASCQYNKKFTDILVNKLDFEQCKADPCLYFKRSQKGIVIVLDKLEHEAIRLVSVW